MVNGYPRRHRKACAKVERRVPVRRFLVVSNRTHRKLSYWRTRGGCWKIGWMHPTAPDPSPAPWTFADRLYGIAHCPVDRDGRVIGCNLRTSDGPLIAEAPAMAAILRDLVARCTD